MADHSGHRQRVKDEFLKRGLEGWAEHRILELLLFYAVPKRDVNELAHDLIDRFGSLAGVMDANWDELSEMKGVGNHTATLLKLIPALSGHYLNSRSEVRSIVRGTRDVYEILAPYFFGATNEKSYILCLDGKNQIIGVRKISEGCIDSASVSIRRIMEEAVSLRAVRIYLAHNHITNIALPSKADISTTNTIRAALTGVGFELVDHLIFVDGDMVSIKDSQRHYELL